MSALSGPPPAMSPLSPDPESRDRGRMGLAIPWDSMPWWAIIVLILGVYVGYSIFANAYYTDALYFILDLPWNKQVVATVPASDIAADGSWSYTFTQPLTPGEYVLYGTYRDTANESLGSGEAYEISVPKGAPAIVAAPLPPPAGEVVKVDTSTPTIGGVAPAGTDKILVIDDFSSQPSRIALRIWVAKGIVLTIKITVLSFSMALIIGLIFGIMRVSSSSPDLRKHVWRRLGIGLAVIVLLVALRPAWRTPSAFLTLALIVEGAMFLLPAMPYTLSTLYVEIVRGVPLLVIILYMGFAVTPALREATNGAIDLRGLPAAVLGLAFGYGAYLAEVFRAGIQAIPRGQMEAARSLGMTYFQSMRHVILPQAIRLVLPPLGNDLIAMLKDSSLVSVIAMAEVLQQGRLWISRNFRAFEGFNSVLLVYLIMTLILSLVVRAVERRAKLPGR